MPLSPPDSPISDEASVAFDPSKHATAKPTEASPKTTLPTCDHSVAWTPAKHPSLPPGTDAAGKGSFSAARLQSGKRVQMEIETHLAAQTSFGPQKDGWKAPASGYTLVRALQAGTFGSVWLAHRDGRQGNRSQSSFSLAVTTEI